MDAIAIAMVIRCHDTIPICRTAVENEKQISQMITFVIITCF